MTKDGWRMLVLTAVREADEGNEDKLDLLATHLMEVDLAKQGLRNKGYGWIGLSILETIKTEVPMSTETLPDEVKDDIEYWNSFEGLNNDN